MRELLRTCQDQRVTLEGGSRAPRDARTVGRTKAQCQREGERVAAVKRVRAITPMQVRTWRFWTSSDVTKLSGPRWAVLIGIWAEFAWTSSATMMRSKPRCHRYGPDRRG